MNLDFTTVAPTAHDQPAVSPMLAAALRSGATAEERDGWLVPTAFSDAQAERQAIVGAVGFADASSLGKTEIHGRPEALLGCAGGLTLGTATAAMGRLWCPLTPTRALVIGATPALADLAGVAQLDVTTQYCALRIAGPLAGELVSRFCGIDLRLKVAPPGALRPGSVARTPATVIVEAEQRLLVVVGAALADYLWTVVADAAQRLGGRPVGADLLAGTPTLLDKAANHA